MTSASKPFSSPGALSRLKQVSKDPLESIGLPSKGDDRLLSFKTQEDYFNKVIHRYGRSHLGGGDSDDLDGPLASLSLHVILEKHSDRIQAISNMKASGGAFQVSIQDSTENSMMLMAMRKVREAIVASSRTDFFALRAYAFIIRATILMRHTESYHPALLHLLHNLHPVTPLTASEHNEFVGYYILDLACRQDDLATVYNMTCHFKYKDARVGAVVRALVHGDWYTFWKVRPLMSGHQQQLMKHSDEGMRRRALDCLGKSYLSVDRDFLERSVQQSWEELREKSKMTWHLQSDVVTIRQIKRK